MGLAASQARLLLLTARKSDLEYRAQQITNSIMILAQQTEEVAREYSVKISNQTVIYQGIDKDQTTTKFSASTISSLSDVDGAYDLKIRMPKYDEKGNPVVDSNGNQVYDWISWKDTGYEDFSGPEILEGYNNGTMKIVYTNQNGEEETIDLNGNNGFVTTYYTDDDKAAEAEYNTKTASIQVKEKRLQNDLNQVQTQQKACDTEIDSVKKIMDKNIERTFKVFS